MGTHDKPGADNGGESVATSTRRMPEKSNNILPQLLKWDDIALMDVSTEWLLDGILPEQAITLFFGSGGTGKSWLAAQIARAVSTGEPFGGLHTVKVPVYYVDFENPLSVLRDRAMKIGHADNLFVWHLACETPPPRLDTNDWTLYKSLPPGLLIFDTLRAANSGDENSSKDMAIVMGRLKELREAGHTILLLHHTPKGNDGTFKGSTAILDLADHIIALERQGKNEDDEFDIDGTFKFGCRIKTRFEPHSFFLSFDPERGFWMKDDPDIETMKVMRDILDREGPLKQKDFKKVLEDKLKMTKDRIFKMLKKGVGTFWSVQRGEKNSAMYSSLHSSIPVFPPNIGAENRKTESGGPDRSGKHTNTNDIKAIDIPEFTSFPDGHGKTEKQDGDLDAAVKYYMAQGLSKSEAIRLAREAI